MKIEMGVWIDHRQAVIVTLLGEKEEIRRIRSNIGRQVRLSSDSQGQSSQEVEMRDNARAKARRNQLKRYYAVVVRWLSTADSIMIFGSGEAKNELQSHLLHHDLATRIIEIKAADKMSSREFATEVRQQFGALNQHSQHSTSQDA